MNFKKVNSLEEASLYQKKLVEEDKDNAIISAINLDKLKINTDSSSILNKCLIAVKNNILIKDHLITASSKMLLNYTSPRNSFVVDKLIENGVIPIVSTNMDELAMGGNARNSYFGPTINSENPNYIVGGSSGGSAMLVAEGKVSVALGSDTGDSVIWPAGINEIVGYKPSWGLISRNGLLDFAPSWDQIGWFSENVEISAALADILIDKDENDLTNIEIAKQFFHESLNDAKNFTIGYSEKLKKLMNTETLKHYEQLLQKLKEKGHSIVNIEFDYNILSSFVFVYRIVSSIESLSTNFNLNGFLFGNDNSNKENNFQDRLFENRTNNFLPEVKRRFALAGHYLLDYTKYEKAKKLRFLIQQEINQKFSDIDLFLFPTLLVNKPTIEEYDNNNGLDLKTNYLGLANATGYPSMNVPFGNEKGKKTGMWISAKPYQDKKLFQLGKQIEEISNEL